VLESQASERARQLGIGILQVFSGLRTPGEASEALGISVNRYYQLEAKGVVGMLAALEPAPRGRRRNPDQELERLRREKEKAEREATRNLALLRAAQKAVGLVPVKKEEGEKKRQRRPRVRARALIDAIGEAAPGVPTEPAVAPFQRTAANPAQAVTP
jgi:hypothetical protein